MSRGTAILLVIGLGLVTAAVVFRVLWVLDVTLRRQRHMIVTGVAALLIAAALAVFLLMYCGCT